MACAEVLRVDRALCQTIHILHLNVLTHFIGIRMPQYDDEMKGVLFINRDKQNPKAPDGNGHVIINGVKYRVAGWKKSGTSNNGNEYMLYQLTVSLENDGQYQTATQTDLNTLPPKTEEEW